MSYDEHDAAAMDEFYERISQELYPEHKLQAIDEFSPRNLSARFM